jgi:hypothetical protein
MQYIKKVGHGLGIKNKKPTRLSGFCGTSSPDASGEPGTRIFIFSIKYLKVSQGFE